MARFGRESGATGGLKRAKFSMALMCFLSRDAAAIRDSAAKRQISAARKTLLRCSCLMTRFFAFL
jgi:hypothetical protein